MLNFSKLPLPSVYMSPWLHCIVFERLCTIRWVFHQCRRGNVQCFNVSVLMFNVCAYATFSISISALAFTVSTSLYLRPKNFGSNVFMITFNSCNYDTFIVSTSQYLRQVQCLDVFTVTFSVWKSLLTSGSVFGSISRWPWAMMAWRVAGRPRCSSSWRLNPTCTLRCARRSEPGASPAERKSGSDVFISTMLSNSFSALTLHSYSTWTPSLC